LTPTFSCISDHQAQGLSSIKDCTSLGFMENADAALVEASRRHGGLIVATWGALKPGHRHLLTTAKMQTIPTWAAFDMDPAGVRFARLAVDMGINQIEGFRRWPDDLGQDLDDEKHLILQQELAIPNHPFRAALEHINASQKWWEQEATMELDFPSFPQILQRRRQAIIGA
jgi:hypothetical protein